MFLSYPFDDDFLQQNFFLTHRRGQRPVLKYNYYGRGKTVCVLLKKFYNRELLTVTTSVVLIPIVDSEPVVSFPSFLVVKSRQRPTD